MPTPNTPHRGEGGCERGSQLSRVRAAAAGGSKAQPQQKGARDMTEQQQTLGSTVKASFKCGVKENKKL
jgi:hypothetical protein